MCWDKLVPVSMSLQTLSTGMETMDTLQVYCTRLYYFPVHACMVWLPIRSVRMIRQVRVGSYVYQQCLCVCMYVCMYVCV